MFNRLVKRLLRGGDVEARSLPGRDLHLPNLRLPDLHLPDLHLRDLHWSDVAALAKGERRERDVRSGVLLPTMLTLAGAGATLFWWRQWAQGRAESEAAATAAERAVDRAGEEPTIAATSVEFVDVATLDTDLAVLGIGDASSPTPMVPLREHA